MASNRDRIVRIHRRLRQDGHDLPVRLWDGTTLGPDDAGFRVVLPTPSALRAMLVPPGDLHVGAAYAAGAFDVEGSMVAAMDAVAPLREALDRRTTAAVGWHVLRLPPPPDPVRRTTGLAAQLRGRRHSRTRDRAAIQHHYDLGVDFYRTFLGSQLVYSCAYFLEGDEDFDAPPDPTGVALDVAQERKLDVVCRKLGLQPGMRLLDVGCGWGGLVVHAATHYGVDALGVTLSQDQAEVARKRVAEGGLADRVEIRLLDYRDVIGTFDAVASIGMVEHVGAAHLAEYASTVWQLLAPGGRFLNHGITTGRRRMIRDLTRGNGGFVGRYVFPDGALVPADHMLGVLQDAGFEVLDLEQLRPHYARTLRHWTARIEAQRDEAIRLTSQEAYRVWRAYMAGSAIGFTNGDLGIIQILGGKDATRPYGRSWMLPAA